jgi:copper oxidase (laccase) domain-containing protein
MIGAAGLSPCCTPAGRAPGLSRKGCASWAGIRRQAATLVAVCPGIGPAATPWIPAGRAVRRQFGGQAVRRPHGRTYLDLRAANTALLEKAGVREVYAAEECTACTDQLFSFRRDGPGFGRLAAFIGASKR